MRKYLKHKAYINLPMLLRVVGWLLLIEALFMAVPMTVAIINENESFMPFLVCMGITAGSGALMTLQRPRSRDMGKREAILLTGFTWVILSLFGMLPFMFYGTHMSVTDAFFETMSGFTTTGASVLPSLDNVPKSILVWRCITQWIGGLGIILFTLAVVPMLNTSGGMQMFNAEVTGITHEKLRPRVSSTAKRLWLVYTLLTVLLGFLYWIGPMGAFDSLCHAFSTMSTGGFSTQADSIGAWNSLYIKIVTTVFMFIGGVNFALIFKLSTGHVRSVWQNETFRLYLMLILSVFVFFDVALLINSSVTTDWESLTIDPLFQIISMMSSTGYLVEGSENWGNAIFSVTLLLMFFGACAGSTSGGAKIDRALLLWKNSRNELYRCIYPNHILSVNSNGRTMSPELVNKVGVFLCLYVLVIVVGGIILSSMGLAVHQAFFSAFSCVSNTGLSTAETGSFAAVSDGGKWVLSLLMLTGRLEVFTVLVLFTPTFWSK